MLTSIISDFYIILSYPPLTVWPLKINNMYDFARFLYKIPLPYKKRRYIKFPSLPEFRKTLVLYF